ncbi:MAG: hypothetical protein F7B18_02170 [Desulfurococcales archaeon]|nr:hypothetical protein [Desulfurococcales archaeon]
MAWESMIDHKIDGMLEREVSKLVEEITFIDRRLAELGDGEEDRAERILLKILRNYLVNDLREIAGFSSDYGYNAKTDVEAVASSEAVAHS